MASQQRPLGNALGDSPAVARRPFAGFVRTPGVVEPGVRAVEAGTGVAFLVTEPARAVAKDGMWLCRQLASRGALEHG